MFQPIEQPIEMVLQVARYQSEIAQVAIPSDETALVFLSGPQFFIALIAGVVMAFAFQFVLTNFSIASDISAGINPFATDTESWGKKLRTIETRVGGWTVFIVNVALFIACFLAVKLALIQDTGMGAIVAIVIWSVYFLLLLWAGSQAVGSLVGAVGSTASSGLQGIMSMIATALSGRAASQQIVNTVEASVEAVTKELQSTLAPRLRENLEDYVNKLHLPQASLKEASNQALNVLNSANLPSIANSELPDIIKSITPEDLASGRVRERLTQLLGLEQNQPQQGENSSNQALQLVVNTLAATLLNQGKSSDLDLNSLTEQFNSFRQNLTNQAHQAADTMRQPSPASVIRADIEDYLLNSPLWYLRPDSLDRGFREVLYDPEADAGLVRQPLEQLNRTYFVSVLQRREGLSSDQINDIADELEVIRQEVLDTVRMAGEQERSQALRRSVETYLSSAPKEALTPDRIQQDFTALLADPEASYEVLGNRLLQFDRDALMQMLLAGRQDLSSEEADQILNELITVRDRFLNQSEEAWNQLQAQATEFRQQVESYLRETNPAELTPATIQQTLQTLLNAPQASLLLTRTRLGQFDRSNLEQILNQRQDLNPEQAAQLIDQFETIRANILHAPQELTEQAKEQYDRLINQIADYLRHTNLEELNPEGIRRDLEKLINDPKAGTLALRRRLAEFDRETLVKLISQREDISQEQVNQIIDQIQDTIRSVIRAPRRLTNRTRDRIQDFQTDLADYLRNTNREELNPEGIRRDLQLLLKRPQAGAAQLGDRLSNIDRGTLVALLSQREDITEEDANRIADQIESVRHQLVEQVHNAQNQVQSMVDSTTDRLRNYLNSLERPELNYEGIQEDVQKLFEDPNAGLEALRQRLSQFDRDTLVAILSSREDLSEEQANRIVDQIESARDRVLYQAERLQAETEKRINALKQQAKEQAEEAQKTVATAAWWLFGTAITSVATAAIAGILASGGFSVVG